MTFISFKTTGYVISLTCFFCSKFDQSAKSEKVCELLCGKRNGCDQTVIGQGRWRDLKGAKTGEKKPGLAWSNIK